MGMLGSLGSVSYDIIANDGTGTGTASSQKNLLAVGAAMTGVGVAAKLMVDDVNRSFIEFDDSMTAVKALGAVSEEEFGKMKDAAIDMSTQVPISATDVSDAMYKMVSVGYDFDTMMATIPEATKLAVGGNMALSDSVDAVINVFGAYGTSTYSAADITNILSKAVGVGKWELGDFVTEMQKNVGVAAQLGISFEDLAAANVLLQNKFTSSEEAGTALKTMLLRLVDPKVQSDLEQLGVHVKDNEGNFVGLESVLNQLSSALSGAGGSSSKLASDLASLGVKVYDNDGKFKGMNTVLNDLNEIYGRTGKLTPELKDKFESLGFKIDEKTGKITLSKKATKEYAEVLSATGGNVDKMSTLQQIFGTEGLRAAMALVEEKDKLSGMSDEMSDAAFKEQAYNTVVESTGAKLEIATNKMEAAKIKLGDAMAPATIIAADAMGLFADAISTLPEPLQGVAGMALYAAQGFAALGPALMGLAALKGLGLASTLGSIASGLSGMASSAGLAIVALGPLAPILIGVALGLAVVYAMKELGFLDWVSEQGQKAGIALNNFKVDLTLWCYSTDAKIQNWKKGVAKYFDLSDAGKTLTDTLGGLKEGFFTWCTDTDSKIQTWRDGIPGYFSSAFSGVGTTIGGGLDDAKNRITLWGSDTQTSFNTTVAGIGTALGGISGHLEASFGDVSLAFKGLGTTVDGIFRSLWDGLLSYLDSLKDGFFAFGKNIVHSILSGLGSVKDSFIAAFGGLINEIAKYIPKSPAEVGPFSTLPNFGGYFSEGMTAAIPEVTTATSETMAAAANTIATADATTEIAANSTPVAAQPTMLGGGTSIGYQDNSAPISIDSINASSDYNVQQIYADISALQAQKNRQKGYRSSA